MLIAGFHNVDFAGSVKRTTPRRITRTLAASAIAIDDTLTAARRKLLDITQLILPVIAQMLDSLARSDRQQHFDRHSEP